MYMKLVVCGCSWSSRDNAYPDTEYGYFVSEHYGWEYQNIARVSGSNFNIRLQIDYAVKYLNPDFIIVNWTTPDRVDWNHKGNWGQSRGPGRRHHGLGRRRHAEGGLPSSL